MNKIKVSVQNLIEDLTDSSQKYALCSSNDGGGACGDGGEGGGGEGGGK